MPRDATETRASLVRAGERAFAELGVDAAPTRAIVAAAGQANDSAVSYHFGSRLGLLQAILDRHIELMDAARRAHLAVGEGQDLRGQVAALVAPTAERLQSQEGRDFLRIIVQLSDRAGVRSHSLPAPLAGTALAEQLELVEAAMPGTLPVAVRRERLAAAILLLTASLADRARRLESGRRQQLAHARYVDNLVDMLVGLLVAPPAAGARP